jgi:hypothetical protein
VRRFGPHLIISILLLATPILAQGGELPNKGNGGKSGGRLDLPPGSAKQDPSQETSPEQTEAYKSEFWGDTKERAELIFVSFEEQTLDRERPTKAQVRAALDNLQSLGLGTRTTALKALGSPHAASVALAAQLLRAVGSREEGDASVLVETSSSVGDVNAARECLDAAVVIDGSLPIRGIALLSHPRRPIRTLAEGRIRETPNPAYVADLLRGLQYGRDTDIRIRCARILADYPTTVEARAGLRAALRDPSVTVCFQAADSIAGTGTAEDRAYLYENIMQTEPGSELAYLLFALLLQQQDTDELIVDQALVEKLRPYLSKDDIFLSGIAGATIAEYVFRSDTEQDLATLRRSLPLVLVRAVGGVEFYPQYARFSPLAEKSLRRISGQDFGTKNRRAWVEWYTANLDTFQLVRGRLELTPENQHELEVSWFHEGRTARLLTASATSALSSDVPGRVLGSNGIKRLAAALQQTVILDVSVLPGTYGLETDTISSGIEVSIGGRRKPIRFRGSSAATWLPGLAEQLDQMYEELEWQLLAQGEDAAAFLKTTAPQWDGAAASKRDQLLVQFQNRRLDSLTAESLGAWCDYLLARPDLKRYWSEPAAYQFLDLIGGLEEQPMLAQKVLKVALMDGNPALTGPTVEIATRFSEPVRSDLLVTGLRLLGPNAGAVCLGDERLPVRVAAARALADGGPEAIPALLSALTGKDVLVVRVALHSLGEIGAPVALEPVLTLTRPSVPREVRKEALLALGAYAGPDVLDALLEAAYAEDFGVRLAAVTALRQVKGMEADLMFANILPRYLNSTLEASFDQSVKTRGAAVARRTYRQYLDHGNTGIRRRASILAGRLGEPAAVEVLMSYLPQTPHDGELLDALAQSTGADFRATPDPAGVYEVWWRDHSNEDPTFWLIDGLKGRGFALENNFVQGSGASAKTIVRNLLDVLETGPTHMRAICAMYLTSVTNIDASHIPPLMSLVQVKSLTKPWRDWLNSDGGKRSE